VVCDIDDTLKVTEVPAGARAVVMNTFYRNFAATTELNATFARLQDAAFHYVSGGPWQLYRPLSAFLIGARHFPEGTFHMKRIAQSIVTPVASLVDLARFVLPGGTRAHKLLQITTIMERFADRTFVLIGDSGEQDPEIYRDVRARFGSRVREVIIRDITNARRLDPVRLSGMTIVEAPTVNADR
jgi:phosphatidate phosphatase APP1